MTDLSAFSTGHILASILGFFELATISSAWYDSFQEPLMREVESAMNLTDDERMDMQLHRVSHANLTWTLKEIPSVC